MNANKGRRMGERKARLMRRGCLEEPGTGSFPWSEEEVAAFAIDQLRTTENWKGIRFSSTQDDDNEIREHLAPRPDYPEPEPMSKQIGHCRAAGALSMALQAAADTGDQAKLAAAMIPSLVEQYIIGCPIGDLAPVGRGGQELPLTKMMALIVILMQQYVSKTRDDKDKTEIKGIPPDLSDPRVQEAVSEVMREAVDQRWDNRSFAVTTETGGSGDDRVNLTIFALCEIKGRSWEEAVGELIASGVWKVKQATSNATRLSQTSRYSSEDFAKQRRELEKKGEIVRLSPKDELLHFVAQ